MAGRALGEGPPFTTCSVAVNKVVGGRPAPAMMVSGWPGRNWSAHFPTSPKCGGRNDPPLYPAAGVYPSGADDVNTALLAEYLALASTLRADSPPSDCQRANQIAFQLAMELDADLWRLMARAVAGKTVNELWEAIVAAGEPNTKGALTVSDAVVHAPCNDPLEQSPPDTPVLRR